MNLENCDLIKLKDGRFGEIVYKEANKLDVRLLEEKLPGSKELLYLDEFEIDIPEDDVVSVLPHVVIDPEDSNIKEAIKEELGKFRLQIKLSKYCFLTR